MSVWQVARNDDKASGAADRRGQGSARGRGARQQQQHAAARAAASGVMVIGGAALSRHRIEMVSCGWQHTLVLTSAAAVFSFGFGGYGALGHGSKHSCRQPRCVQALLGQMIVSVSAGSYSSFAVSSQAMAPGAAGVRRSRRVLPLRASDTAETGGAGGIVWAFGWNCCGHLGQGHKRNVLVPTAVAEDFNGNALPPVIGVAAGHQHTLLLTKSGRIMSCGSGKHGRLGYFCSTEEWRFRAVEATLEGDDLVWVASVSAGFAHSAAISHKVTLATAR